MMDEIIRAFRIKVAQRIFGDEWRPDRPLESLGAEMEVLLSPNGVKDFADYRARTGRVVGLREAIAVLDEVIRELNDPKPGERT